MSVNDFCETKKSFTDCEYPGTNNVPFVHIPTRKRSGWILPACAGMTTEAVHPVFQVGKFSRPLITALYRWK